MKKPETYTIAVRPEGNGVPGIIRVRGLLKAALRQFGLRCVLIGYGTEATGCTGVAGTPARCNSATTSSQKN